MKRINFALENETPVVPPVETPAVPAEALVAKEPASVEVPAVEVPVEVPAEEVSVVDSDDDSVDTDALLADNETDANFDDLETTSAVMESLSMYASNIEYLIATESCTTATADLITFGVQQQLNRLGEQGPKISLESGTDIVQQHQVALEGIRDIWKRLAQTFVLSIKHNFMIFFDALRSNTGLVSNYDKKITAAEAEYKTDKGDWKDNNHKGSLVELWYHFANDKGQAKNVMSAVSDDMELSKYILEVYPSELISLLGKLTSAARSSKATTLKDAAAFAKRVEALQHPADVFRKNYVTEGKPYLSVTGLEMTQGTARNVITIGDKALTKLAELATPRAVVESWSAKHNAVKVAAHMAVPGTIELTTAEIGTMLNYARAYLTNIKAFLGLTDKMRAAIDDYSKAMSDLASTGSNELAADEINQIQQLLKQVDQYGNNITYCFKKPAQQEIARSLKGSKYARYLGLRMISNAK
jgi:hypothetical protein